MLCGWPQENEAELSKCFENACCLTCLMAVPRNPALITGHKTPKFEELKGLSAITIDAAIYGLAR